MSASDPVHETGAAMVAQDQPNELVLDAAFASDVRRLVEHARSSMDQEVLPAVEKAWRYYHFEVDQDPLGAFEKPSGELGFEGSRVVEARVRDTINSLLPDVYRVFLSSHEVVEFEPRGAEDVEPAQQATDVISARFWRKGGATFLHDAILAWLIKFAAIRIYHEPCYEEVVSEFDGLDETAMLLLTQDPDLIELDAAPYDHPVLAPVPTPDGMGIGGSVQVANLVCYRGRHRRRVLTRHEHKFALVPQEELLVDLDAPSLATARIVGTDSRRTVSEVVALGIPYETVKRHAGSGSEAPGRFNTARQEREGGEGHLGLGGLLSDVASRHVRLVDAHVRLDRDDDGLAETYHVLCLGETAELVDAWEEEWPDYVVSSPCPIPHRIVGEGIAELMMDRQEIATALVRRFLDNLNAAVKPRSVGELRDTEQRRDVESLYGGHINIPVGQLEWFSVPFVGQYALQGIEYFQQSDILRSGVSPAGQGLDPNVLKGMTVEGARTVISAPQSRTDFFVRLFAEGIMAPLFRALLKLHVQFPNQGEVIRLRNKWVPIDPRSWQSDYDAAVRVGLGHGAKDEKMVGLQLILSKQEQLMAMGSPLVDLEKYHNTLSDLANLVGIKDPRRYLNDATPEMQQQAQAQGEQQKQEAVQMQATLEQAKAAAKAQADAQLAQVKGEVEAMLAQQEAAAKERQILLEAQQKQLLTALEARFEIELQRHRTPSGNGRLVSQVQ